MGPGIVEETVDRLVFQRADTGKVNEAQVFRRMGAPERCPLTDKPLPAGRVSVELSADLLERFTGVYELAPGFAIEISLAESLTVAPPAGDAAAVTFTRKDGIWQTAEGKNANQNKLTELLQKISELRANDFIEAGDPQFTPGLEGKARRWWSHARPARSS